MFDLSSTGVYNNYPMVSVIDYYNCKYNNIILSKSLTSLESYEYLKSLESLENSNI
tara:strand:- start:7887 stop:8054 length:168 start_codon:yes stop_codon:yes gene_type:complete